MRAAGFFLLLAVTTTPTIWGEETADINPGPQAIDAPAYVKQLSSERYESRVGAYRELERLGPQALVALQTQRDSQDTEVRTSVNKLLPMAEDQASSKAAYQLWKTRMKSAWPEALKAGKLSGPLLGVDTFDPQSRVRFPQDADFMQVKQGLHEPDLVSIARWLAEHQEKDGHWISRKSGSELNADLEETALCLMALMDMGHSEKNGAHQETVLRAIGWLLEHQRKDGALMGGGWQEADGVAHALSALALSHAAAYSQIPSTIDAAQKAADYSFTLHVSELGAKHQLGGFGREAHSRAPDVFTTLLFAMQWKAAQTAGLRIPDGIPQGITAFLDSIKSTSDALPERGGKPGLYAWVPGGKTGTEATLMAMLARQQLGDQPEELAGTLKLAFERYSTPRLDREYSDVLLNYCGMALKLSQSREEWIAWFRPLRQHYRECLYYDLAGNEYWLPNGYWQGISSVTNTALCSLTLVLSTR